MNKVSALKIPAIIVLALAAAAAVLAAVFSANAAEPMKSLGGGLSVSYSADEGEDYTYTGNVLTIISSNAITVSGTTTTDRIVVDSTEGANITLKDLDLRTGLGAAFEIAETTTGKVTITLDGKNFLSSGSHCAGLQKNGDTSDLLINGNGGLQIYAGIGGAGIVGAEGKSSGNIQNNVKTDSTKIIDMVMGAGGGACIGGGEGGNGTNITINDGYVHALHGGSGTGAGIGGGENGEGRNITINGGNISASSYSGAGIGGGEGKDGVGITITGGYIMQSYSGSGAGIGGGEGGIGRVLTIIRLV